ncbi:MAG: hypothetical protein NTU62_12440 [Spirochaetes bacterium]|nr:hypothetical protein [Spirochaetota bacterium]
MKTNGILRLMGLLVAVMVMTAATAAADASPQASAHAVRFSVLEVAMVSLVGPDTLRLEAGGDREGTMLLQYTATNAAGAYRTISVQWRAGERAPAGTSLRVRAVSVPAGCGRAAGEILVGDLPTGMIAGIPSCTTGRGGSGALLRYRLAIDDPSQVHEGESVTVTLVFTIGSDL